MNRYEYVHVIGLYLTCRQLCALVCRLPYRQGSDGASEGHAITNMTQTRAKKVQELFNQVVIYTSISIYYKYQYTWKGWLRMGPGIGQLIMRRRSRRQRRRSTKKTRSIRRTTTHRGGHCKWCSCTIEIARVYVQEVVFSPQAMVVLCSELQKKTLRV